VREFCAGSGIVYQGFSLLTANRDVLIHPDVARLAASHRVTPAQIVFRFALDVGMIALTGTTSAEHMRADLDGLDLQLKREEVARIEGLMG
jgi:diketogulonate reductase-like aldo/keto reductase